jgi:tetratricopeptide (TPR) repeat protein
VDSTEREPENLPEPVSDGGDELAFLADKDRFRTAHEQPSYRLFSTLSVGVATFFGSPAAGGLILAINYWRLGQWFPAAAIFAAALATTAGLAAMCAAFTMASDTVQMAETLAFVGAFCVAGTASAVAEMLQGRAIRRHEMFAGKAASPGIALSIGLAFAAVVCLSGWQYLKRTHEPFDLYEAGLAAARDGDADRADTLLTRAILLRHDFGKAYFERGIVRARKNQLELAIDDLDKAVVLLPGQTSALLERGRYKLLLNRNEEAVADLTQALLQDPSADAYYERAKAYFHCGRLREATVDCSLALRMELRSEFLRLRAKCYDHLGDAAKAAFDRSSADHLDAGPP